MTLDNSTDNPFDVKESETSVSDPDAFSGTGGGDMSAWGLTGETRMVTLITASYTNNSSYTFVKGLSPAVNRESPTTREKVESVDTPNAVDVGTGGGTMNAWTLSRSQQLSVLIQATYTDNSSFGIPQALTSGNFNGFSISSDEVFHGVSATGTVLDQYGSPLSGTASIEANGEIINSKQSTGKFRLTSIPPLGVFYGESLGLGTYDFRFSPNVAAVDFLQEDIGNSFKTDAIQYGEIQGTIRDYYGNPAQSIPVIGPGDSDVTGSNGNYSFIAPGGTGSVTLRTLGGSYEFTLTPPAGGTVYQDLRYPLLEIKVKDASLEPAENVPVDVDGKRYYTDESGVVSFPKAEVKGYNIEVMDRFQVEGYQVTTPGEKYQLSLVPGQAFGDTGRVEAGSVVLEVIDAENGQVVENVEAIIVDEEVISLSNSGGVVKLLSEKVGQQATVVIANDDNRYEREVVNVSVPDSATVRYEIALNRKRKTPTY